MAAELAAESSVLNQQLDKQTNAAEQVLNSMEQANDVNANYAEQANIG